MKTHRIQPAIYQYTFGPHEPVLRIAAGDAVVAETRDAAGADRDGQSMPDHMKQRLPGTSLRESNPLVGPIYVAEAEQGDLLAVHIRAIRLTRDYAYSLQGPRFGSLTGEGPGKTLLYNEPIPRIEYRWRLDLQKNVGHLELPGSRIGGVAVPLRPFIGSIGVAPRYGRIETSLTPGEYGGNMDFRELCAGTVLYLPVWVRGAYLSFGDIHALQGDGEVNGTALEVTAEVTLEIEVVKLHGAGAGPGAGSGGPPEWPRLVDERWIMAIGSGRPLLDCIRISQMELLNWLTGEHGFQREEAWQLMAQVGEIRVANIVDPAYTAVSRFPRAYLPGEAARDRV
jgi:amidase